MMLAFAWRWHDVVQDVRVSVRADVEAAWQGLQPGAVFGYWPLWAVQAAESQGIPNESVSSTARGPQKNAPLSLSPAL